MSDRELGWDDTIQNDSGDFILLPDGEYEFLVMGFERARHGGSAKLPPCNKAVIEIEIDGGEKGTLHLKENLFLHTKTEGLLCSFFRSIGKRKSGEPLVMNWNEVPLSRGRLKLGTRTWEKDGEKRKANQVKAWLDPKTEPAPQQTGYQNGTF